MKVEITQTDYFYKEGEQYEVSENTRWGCYMTQHDKSLIRVSHAKKIVPTSFFMVGDLAVNYYTGKIE